MSKTLTGGGSFVKPLVPWHKRLERIEHLHHVRPHLKDVHSVRLPGNKGFLDWKPFGSGDIVGHSEKSKREAAERALAQYDKMRKKVA
jgi:hypothetical protein